MSEDTVFIPMSAGYAFCAAFLGIPVATLADLRAGTHVVVPLGHLWDVKRHDETGTSSVTFHYRDDGFAKAEAMLVALTSATTKAQP